MVKDKLLQVFRIILFPLMLGLSLAYGGWLRIQNIDLLEGKYLLGTDSYEFLRQADYIDRYGKLPDKDMMRWLPEGRDLSTFLSSSAYLMAYLAKLVRLFAPATTIYDIAVYYSVFCYLLVLLFFYFLVSKVFEQYTALFSVLLMTLAPVQMYRSMAGFADRDALVLLLAVFSSYCYFQRIQASNHTKQWFWNIAFGIVMMFLGLTWEGVGLFLNIFVGISIIKLLATSYQRTDFYYDIFWFGIVSFGLLTLTRTYRGNIHYGSPYAFFALVPCCIFLLTAGIYFNPKISKSDKIGNISPPSTSWI